jgi:hypothetical protein
LSVNGVTLALRIGGVNRYSSHFEFRRFLGVRQQPMTNQFYVPDLGTDQDSPFARDADGKLVRRGFWLDMSDRSLVLAMTQGLGAHLTNDQKRAHLRNLGREHLIDQVCVQEILPPEN